MRLPLGGTAPAAPARRLPPAPASSGPAAAARAFASRPVTPQAAARALFPSWGQAAARPVDEAPVMSIPLLQQVAPTVLAMVEQAVRQEPLQEEPETQDEAPLSAVEARRQWEPPGLPWGDAGEPANLREWLSMPARPHPRTPQASMAFGPGRIHIENVRSGRQIRDAANKAFRQSMSTQAERMEPIAAAAARQAESAAGLKPRKERIERVTLEDWNAMTPEQQSALQFNADLVRAVRRDRRNQDAYDPTAKERREYQDAVRDIFGTTETAAPKGIAFAPETVGLLTELGLRPSDRPGTLDDYLQLDTAITAKQVSRIDEALPENLIESVAVPVEGPITPAGERGDRFVSTDPRTNRLSLAQQLAGAQQQLQERLAVDLVQGKRLLAGMSGQEGNVQAQAFGALPGERAGRYALDPAESEQLAAYLDAIANRPEIPLNELVGGIQGDMEARGVPADRQQKMYAGLVEAARSAATGEVELSFGIHSPQQVAQAFGVPLVKVG